MSITTIIMILAIIYFVIIPSFKTRVFPVSKLIIMPAIFMYMNYESITEHFHVQFSSYGVIIAGLIAGILIGTLLRKNTTLKSDREKKLIEMPGSYFGLFIFVVIFTIHFVIGYLKSTNPAYLLHISNGEQLLIFLLTCASSMTIGANAVLFYKYLKAPHSDLIEIKK